MSGPTLFDPIARVDPSPAGHAEDSFSFMNRVHQAFWARVREVLDSWFAEYPRDARPDTAARFRDADPRQHFAAWWELYLFTLYRRLGYAVQVHPTVPGSSGKPDLLVARADDELYIEAAVVNSGIVDDEGRHAAREAWIYDAVNEAYDPNFHVQLEFDRVGMGRPKPAEIVRPLQEWLSGLDPDTVAGALDAGNDIPELELSVRDWELVFTPLPIKREARGQPGRLLGIYPASTGFVNDKEAVRRTLARKRRGYGLPDKPFVIALLCTSSFMSDEDIEQALMGSVSVQYWVNDPSREARWVRQRDGFWMRGTRPRGTRVSGALVGKSLFPWNCTHELPRLWLNPWATLPLHVTAPFPTTSVDARSVFTHWGSDVRASDVLGLPEGWPGPEGLFEG